MENNKSQILKIKNNTAIELDKIPIYSYSDFSTLIVDILSHPEMHCVNYFGFLINKDYQFIAAIADDLQGDILLLSFKLLENQPKELNSLTPQINALHIFEREIYENFGINFIGHPWLKPLRFSHNRFNKNIKINDYPFYQIKSHELHEVGVGPIHAGVIEPGHFRFICNGENVLHLEIQLGWQHRGVENLFLEKKNLLQRTILSESIAGDTAVGHSITFAQLMEALGGIQNSEQLMVERAIALELERIAVHLADLSALCTDVAYNLGASVFGVLRTGIINFTQSWCGNRLGKGMVRVGGINLPFTKKHKADLITLLDEFINKFIDISHLTFKVQSVENRFDNIGVVSEEIARKIGVVGMAARMANVNRDIRQSHPYAGYIKYPIEPVVLTNGDVFSRFLLRRKEIKSSVKWIKNVLANESFDNLSEKPKSQLSLQHNSFAISLSEAWRGEICHCAVTNSEGELLAYKIKDPSIHNWKALEISLRNLEISDFPINNKSYNLSYCGFDL